MEITWLGQNGFWIEDEDIQIMVDPYLADSLFEKRGAHFKRQVPVSEEYLHRSPDLLLFSHAHEDHMNFPSLRVILDTKKEITILAPSSVYELLKPDYQDQHKLVLFDEGTEWSQKGVIVRAVRAVHSDPSPIGFLVAIAGRCLYITGDTLYNQAIIRDVQSALLDWSGSAMPILERPQIDLFFVVINGSGNNMNICDAVRMASQLQPIITVPVHWGLFRKYSDDPDIFIDKMDKTNLCAKRIPFFQPIQIDSLLEV